MADNFRCIGWAASLGKFVPAAARLFAMLPLVDHHNKPHHPITEVFIANFGAQSQVFSGEFLGCRRAEYTSPCTAAAHCTTQYQNSYLVAPPIHFWRLWCAEIPICAQRKTSVCTSAAAPCTTQNQPFLVRLLPILTCDCCKPKPQSVQCRQQPHLVHPKTTPDLLFTLQILTGVYWTP